MCSTFLRTRIKTSGVHDRGGTPLPKGAESYPASWGPHLKMDARVFYHDIAGAKSANVVGVQEMFRVSAKPELMDSAPEFAVRISPLRCSSA